MTKPKTLFDKIWDEHVVVQEPGAPAVLYIDLQLVHEVTSPQAFADLRQRGLKVRRPDHTVATMDHSTPTIDLAPFKDMTALIEHWCTIDPQAARQLEQLRTNCIDFGIPLHELGTAHSGIVHVIGPEMGLVQPGMTIVCGDSHTATHGAFGALAFGIGTTEVEHVLATQCLLQHRPKTCAVQVEGRLSAGVGAKDIILALIAKIGTAGGTGYAFEYVGSTIRNLTMEERMTICNMTIEGGARSGLVAPDETTFEYLSGREYSPRGKAWEDAMARWRALPSDEDAHFDKTIALNVSDLKPMITYGTSPGMGMKVTEHIPDPGKIADLEQRQAIEKALVYMDLKPGQPLLGHSIDVVFIGSCTNGRISDLRLAAQVLRGRKVAQNVHAMIVPGSQAVRRQAEAEGLDRVFKEAGADWREPGCSMCIAMNGDQLSPGQYAVSTSNRNFEGRQGKGGRTFLASPWTAAASAIEGKVADVRKYL